jgi:DNA-binding transcriptional LysR family regulator
LGFFGGIAPTQSKDRLTKTANGAIAEPGGTATGVLRVTADPVFAEAFLPALVAEYAMHHTEVRVDVVLTRRRVDLVQEGFDAAFRIGAVDEPGLVVHRLGAARVRYCANPAYLMERRSPESPRDLRDHDCIVLASDGPPMPWPFKSSRGVQMLTVEARARVSDFALVREFVAAGMGIGNFPAFACAGEIARGRLAPVLDDWVPDTIYVALVHPRSRYPAARVQDFVKLTQQHFAQAPWV